MKTQLSRILLALPAAFALAAMGAQPSQGTGGGADPAVSAVEPSASLPAAPKQGASAGDAPALPLAAYSALGSSLEQTGHLGELGWSEAQFNAFIEGLRSAYQGKPFPMDDAAQRLAAEVGRRIGELGARGQAQAQAAWNPADKERLARYFRDMQKRLSLQIADSGLGYNVQPGRNGVRPRPGDTIVLTVNATAADGTTRLPQLSAERIRVRMEGMLPGLMEGLQMMTVGSEAVFVLPPSLSFGDKPWPDGVGRGSPLVYWVTLHDVTAAQP